MATLPRRVVSEAPPDDGRRGFRRGPRWLARVERRLVMWDPDVRRLHRRRRLSLRAFVAGGDLRTWLSAPVVYSLAVPLVLLDLWVLVFQAICFRAWGLARVRRRPYFAFDRRKLAYLNGLEQLNCVFCAYANGLLAYVREVAARTERYWCPIRHARRVRDPHRHYPWFVEYGDADAYRRNLSRIRRTLAIEPQSVPDTRGESRHDRPQEHSRADRFR